MSDKKTGEKQRKSGKSMPIGIRFKKGESGNPKGRPKGKLNYKTVISKILTTQIDSKILTKLKLSKIQMLLPDISDSEELYWTNLLLLSLKGNSKAIETLAFYAYGKPPQTIQTDEPLQLEFSIKNANPFQKN